ncbi:MAG: aminomethyl transferase family protein [Verrucomicrobia bacterium]|nr:aminomethyl transferase family protein [Verrucomicrobiota bacterium]
MVRLALHELHQDLNATFAEVNGAEVVSHYGDALAEHAALRETAGVIELSFRSRLCLTGKDRVRFLHGQVTNDVKRLRVGEGCYAALVTAKGKMQSDLNIFCLQDELLLDFEPGLTAVVTQRLEKYIVADDVQVVDVAPHYGLLSVQGPKAGSVVRSLSLFAEIPNATLSSLKVTDPTLGEIYLMKQSRLGRRSSRRQSAQASPEESQSRLTSAATVSGHEPHDRSGFDLFVPLPALGVVADKLIAAAKSVGGLACGWMALEMARIEAGIPRFGADMDETNIALECGIEARAVSYNKGCYIGQEVINRIHTIGHVNRELRGLRLADDLKTLPVRGDKLFKDGKEVGHITSAIASPTLKANVALGYVRREANAVGTELKLRSAGNDSGARIVQVPFGK